MGYLKHKLINQMIEECGCERNEMDCNERRHITTEDLKHICDLTVELTKLRVADVPHLCIENFAPGLLGRLLHEASAAITATATAGT